MTAHDVREPVGSDAAGSLPVATRLARRWRSVQWRKERPVSTARPERLPLSPARAVILAATVTASVLGLWFVLYGLALSGLQEGHAQHLLSAQLRQEIAEETAPSGGKIALGKPVARISAVAIGLNAVVVEGTASAQLSSGPGHLPSTPLPGQAGNSQIYGRSAMYGAPFGRVHALVPGVMIKVTTEQGVFGYRVIDVRGPGNPVPSAAQFGKSSLTFVTSAGSGWRSGWAPNYVIYADATLASGKVVSTPSGRPNAIPAADKPLATDTDQLVLLPYFVLAAVLLCAGLAWAATRWTMRQLWIVGVPAAVAVLWIATNSAMLLMPNLA
ncbi:MAG TPA: class E sortase [Streptosporangiaceae bacterium]